MKKMPIAAFCCGVAVAGFLGIYVVPYFAFAQSAEVIELQKQISDRNNRLKQIEAEIAQFKSDLQKVGSEKNTLQKAISQLELERKKISADISYTENKIGSTDLEISKLNIEITQMESDIAKNKEAIGEIVRRVNETDQESLLITLLRNENLAEFWGAIEELQDVKNAMGTRIKELVSLKSLLEDKRNDEQIKRGDLVDLKNQYRDQNSVLASTKEEKADLLKKTKNKESEYQTLLAERVAARKKFEEELRSLESKLQFTLDPSSIPTSGSGVLAWPLDSVYITQYFGDTSFARAGAYNGRGHNGIDFGASRGTPIRAALSGKVQAVNTQVAPMCQYGKWVLIQHPNGLSTLYGHLSVVSVNQGDSVSTGTIIGYSGDTGYATGPHLHFTVYASKAVNFTQYTCNSGITLTIPVSAPSGYLNPIDYLPK